jgi:hypothetical protein
MKTSDFILRRRGNCGFRLALVDEAFLSRLINLGLQFLRRHYPDQVRGSRAGLPSSQPEYIRLPVQFMILQSLALWDH